MAKKTLTQREKLTEATFKCWQAATLLEAMSKSRLSEMDGTDISVALEGIHGILASALYEMEDLEVAEE